MRVIVHWEQDRVGHAQEFPRANSVKVMDGILWVMHSDGVFLIPVPRVISIECLTEGEGYIFGPDGVRNT